MSRFLPLPEKEIEYHLETLPDLELKIISACTEGYGWSYEALASKLGVDYGAVRSAGQCLQSANLAAVKPVRSGNEYNGSAIFLNANGLRIRERIIRPA